MSGAKITAALSSQPLCREFVRTAAEAGIDLDLQPITPIHRAFRPMVMQAAFDLSELAIVTAIQAVEHGKPIVPLPITVAARFQHKCILQDARRGMLRPADLPGRRVAVRAYSQTTGTWVRTILEMEYGVPSASIVWVTQEGPHVAEAAEPANVERVPTGQSLLELLASGQVDAAIFGNDMPTEEWACPVIEDPDRAGRASYARSGIVPINHVLAVSREFAQRHPDAVRSVYHMFAAARDRILDAEQAALFPRGTEMRKSVEALLSYAASQHLTARALTFEDVFGAGLRLVDGE